VARLIGKYLLALVVMSGLQSCTESATQPRPLAPNAALKTTLYDEAFDAQPMMDAFPGQYSIDSTVAQSSGAVTYDLSTLDDGSAIVCRDHFKPIDLWWNSPAGVVLFHLDPPLLLVSKGPGTYTDNRGLKFANSVYESMSTSTATDALGQRWAFKGKFRAYCRNGNLELGPIVFGGQMLVALGPLDPPYRVEGSAGEGGGSCYTQLFYDPDQECPGGGGGTGGGDEGGGGSGGGSGGGGGCLTEYIILEISYDGGNTWSVWWEGYASVCS
jgi:uncharacterized membrane protein YgcG